MGFYESASVAMQAAQGQTVSGATGSIATALQLVETVQNRVVGEALIGAGLRQSTHGLGGGTAQARTAAVDQSRLDQVRQALAQLFSAAAEARFRLGYVTQRRQ